MKQHELIDSTGRRIQVTVEYNAENQPVAATNSPNWYGNTE